MENDTNREKKKNNIKTIIILVLVFAAIIGIIIFELDYFDVIDLNYQPKYLELTYDQLGSAKKLEGRTAMVTIFASDNEAKWDFSQEKSIERRRSLFEYTKVAADWMIEQGKKYGKELEFCYPADENDELLYYEHDFGDNVVFDNSFMKIAGCVAYDEWDYIEKNIDSELIKQKLDCENIVYYFYTNYEGILGSAFQLQVKTIPNEKPYECVFVSAMINDKAADPILIAHETLHTFGAIDFYGIEKGHNTFNIPEEFVEHARRHYSTDIMYITGGFKDRTYVYDRIDGEITAITAYYLGWIEKAPFEVDWYRMYRSQFDKKGT